MVQVFENALIGHVVAKRVPGSAFETVLTRDDFSRAFAEISSWDGYGVTPTHQLTALANELGLDEIFYKDEGSRFGLGSFKALGAAYACLRLLKSELSNRLGTDATLADVRNGRYAKEAAKLTVTSATDGNHGRSLAWGAKTFGAACTIFIHKDVSQSRADAMQDLGAQVIRVDGDYDDSIRVTREQAQLNGWFIVSDTSWEGYTQQPLDVMAGYGVMVLELAQQLPSAPTHIFVQGGVGGLAAAVAAAARQVWETGEIRLVVVEPELAPCLFESGKSGIATCVNITEETLMAGLSCGEPSQVAWQILREEAFDFLTIPESLVGPTMRLAAHPLGDDPKIVAGESAVAGMAGLIVAARQPALRLKLGLNQQSRILLIGSEGATDLEIYRSILAEAP